MANTNETKRIPAITATVLATGDEQNPMPFGLTIRFADGRGFTIRRDELSARIEAMAIVHGLKQKLVDAAAISRNPETGRSATIADKYAAVKEVYDRLLAGAWNAEREGGGSGSLLFKALCRMYADKDPATLREWLDKKTDAEKAALRKNPKVAALIVEIQAENAKADGINTDELLNELDESGE